MKRAAMQKGTPSSTEGNFAFNNLRMEARSVQLLVLSAEATEPGESHRYSVLRFTRAQFNSFTLLFRALQGRNRIVSTPGGATEMLCFN